MLNFPNLTWLKDLTYYQRPDKASFGLLTQFPYLTSLTDSTITRGHKYNNDTIGSKSASTGPPELYINGSLLLRDLQYDDRPDYFSPDYEGNYPWGAIWDGPDLTNVVSINGNATIVANNYTRVHLNSLRSVGHDVYIVNNTSCSFGLDQLSSVRSIKMVDNPGSILPSLHRLEMADNIHIRGCINT
jgi:hypothetical protein